MEIRAKGVSVWLLWQRNAIRDDDCTVSEVLITLSVWMDDQVQYPTIKAARHGFSHKAPFCFVHNSEVLWFSPSLTNSEIVDTVSNFLFKSQSQIGFKILGHYFFGHLSRLKSLAKCRLDNCNWDVELYQCNVNNLKKWFVEALKSQLYCR